MDCPPGQNKVTVVRGGRQSIVFDCNSFVSNSHTEVL